MAEKLKSRKFWVAAISILVGVLGLLGAEESLLQLLSSAGLILVPAVVYIVTEGKVDAAAVKTVDMEALAAAVQEYMEASGKSGGTRDTASGEKTSGEAG
ncbi:hypothetical protein [Papillibacter cinnamivorans]|uniref:Uncharacterized protein n=1 Tax=Papillibacter cinnamivorans DSM 12816 TaxID=1122930 RepID=A0A1W2C3L1_9FIRM|nr:hypothetical protein [Papillibacter cinnamivorans]SMC79815.1 hypothetical protein SAMN02745168_2537 [Papillibacter cinnamivorans DSM 12816]